MLEKVDPRGMTILNENKNGLKKYSLVINILEAKMLLVFTLF